MLGITQFDSPYSPNKQLAEGDVTSIFARLLQMDDKTVLRVLTFAMAESLQADSQIVEAIPHAVHVDMAALWKPDEAFFELLRDKRVINAMVKDIAGKRTADGALTETGKKQKQIIRNRMAGHGVSEARPDWRPKWMCVPASSYLDEKSCPIAVHSHNAGKILEQAKADAEPEPVKKAA